MKLHRFIGTFDLSAPEIRLMDTELIMQLVKVLRVKIGEQIVLCDGRGMEARMELMRVDLKEVLVKTLETPRSCPEPVRQTHLYCAIVKRENFELIAQKAVEVGVTQIVPILSRRTVKLDLKLERLAKIMKEAAELSGRGTIPTICAPMKFIEAVAHAEPLDIKLLFESRSDLLETILQQEQLRARGVRTAAVFIGPEGGWETEEIALATDNGFQLASMGELTFRAETAAIVATYLLSLTH